MEDYPLAIVKGRMTDRQFLDSHTCLVAAINASSFKLGGIAKDLAKTYTYANLYENRKQLYNLNRTISSDRPDVASLVVKEPVSGSLYPTVVGMVTQFGQGEYVEKNPVAKYFIESSRDGHYVAGLLLDTMEKRLDNFKMCLKLLADYVEHNKTIRRVVFPSGIGRRGIMDHEWKMSYLRELKSFALHMDLNNIKVLLLEKPSPLEEEGGEESRSVGGRQ